MHDDELRIDLATDFVKTETGESWAVRVTGTPRRGASGRMRTAVVFHVAAEEGEDGNSTALACGKQDKQLSPRADSKATCRGTLSSLGPFELHVTGDDKNRVIHETLVTSVQVPEEKIWQAKSMTSREGSQ